MTLQSTTPTTDDVVVKSYAETKGDLRIIHADGEIEIIGKDEADRRARAIVKPKPEDDDYIDLTETDWAPISSGLMLTDPEDDEL